MASEVPTTPLPPPIETRLEEVGDVQLAMLQATHNPDWYEYAYKNQVEEMKGLLATIALRLEAPKGARNASDVQKEALNPKKQRGK